jgi:hypothetical protein
MLTNCFYSQKQVGKGRNLCSYAKSSARQRKPANPNHFIFLSDDKFFYQDQKTNSQNSRYHCSDHKDVPIVVHSQDWLKAKSDEPPVEGNVASQLTRI